MKHTNQGKQKCIFANYSNRLAIQIALQLAILNILEKLS